MFALLSAVFVASLLGSLHCAGMCGPLALLAVQPAGAAHRRWKPHLAYHGGRLLAYAALGAACGAIGLAVDRGAGLAGLQRAAALLAGATIVTLGLAALIHEFGWWPRAAVRMTVDGRAAPRGRLRRGLAWLSDVSVRVMRLGHRAASGLPPGRRAALIGVMTPCLPCGWLYAFAITAAGAAGPLAGAAVLTAFWLGTVPVLLGIGLTLRQVAAVLGGRVRAIAAVAMIVLGVLTALQRVNLPLLEAPALAAPPVGVSDVAAIDRVNSLDSSQAPCCHGGG